MARDHEPRDIVHVLREDPDLAQDLDPGQLRRAYSRSAARLLTPAAGSWVPVLDATDEATLLGLLVLGGVILRRVILAARRSAEVIGTGDLIRPFEDSSESITAVPCEVRWHVLSDARLAVLDERFQQSMAACCPEVLCRLAGRQSRRCQEQALSLAIAQLPRLDARIHFALWRLAARFGQVGPEGVLVPLKLSHEVLGELVAARRPSVTAALHELDARGLVSRLPDGRWRLAGRAPETLAELGRTAVTLRP